MSAETPTPAAALAQKAKTPFPGESDAYRGARETLLAEEIESAQNPQIRFATSSSITSVAPPPMDWTRASRDMRSTGVSRM